MGIREITLIIIEKCDKIFYKEQQERRSFPVPLIIVDWAQNNL